jgi:hypothetical protein
MTGLPWTGLTRNDGSTRLEKPDRTIRMSAGRPGQQGLVGGKQRTGSTQMVRLS